MSTWSRKSVGVAMVASSVALSPAAASAQSDAEAYATFYGDGLRHYIEGRYDQAVEELYRAYALRPSGAVASLLVRSYDFMGHCGAAMRQLDLYRQAHPRDAAVRLQRCEDPAELFVDCEPAGAPIKIGAKIGAMIESQCGTTIALAPGVYQIWSGESGRASQEVRLLAGTKEEVRLEGRGARPWSVVENNTRIPRLQTPSDAYRVIRSTDGLYEIWVRADMGRDPDMFPLDSLRLRPYVEMICADEGGDEDRIQACYFLQRLQDQQRYYVDDPERFESQVPRVP